MPVTTLLRKPAAAPPASTERQKLADAIAAREDASRRLTLLREAASRARLTAADARDAMASAKQAAADVFDAQVRHAVATISDPALPRPPSPADCARRLAEAEAEAKSAAAIVSAIDSEASELDTRIPLIGDSVDRAADAVLRAEMRASVQPLVAELFALHRQLADKTKALLWLVSHGVANGFGQDADPGVGELECSPNHGMRLWPIWNSPAAAPTIASWDAALAVLKSDPTAPVPSR
jgi:hypothetical protein